jgi:hypothetical protein
MKVNEKTIRKVMSELGKRSWEKKPDHMKTREYFVAINKKSIEARRKNKENK